ncbi:hypothetical protein N7E81_18770 [Reichenbachiella carrageenanivorans]|uniref:Right handed beta helix region n=1 Tax=Reichenbachiella carrageenanivorans TaxID=2979869 RepID=A0ABY6D128_9BACT|nr:hypothetical protein [Reichenbachiella carrageenanivorans]UXX79399.1 hypothetical protein N7E81_18770 [Reichenbachiella carrageenanivorans]
MNVKNRRVHMSRWVSLCFNFKVWLAVPSVFMLMSLSSPVEFSDADQKEAITYYVDATAGDDSNRGDEQSQAFRSLSKINELKLQAGDQVLFKRGHKWSGTLKPQGSGTEKAPIVIGAYGEGARPSIDGEGKKEETDTMSAGLILYNQEYFEIRDIEIRNFEKGDPAKPIKKAGIFVLAKDIGTLHGFKFENVRIADVNGSLKTRENGGVFFSVIADEDPDKRVPTNFDGIYMVDCHIYNVDRGGFLNQSYWRNRDFDSKFGEMSANNKLNNWYPSLNLLIEKCKFEEIGGNGLVTRVVAAPVVQNNLFIRNSTKTTGNASYPYNCDDALWQFNEACYTVYNEGDVDASGFDSDYLCKNTIIQYNYSHHNDWGGLLVCSWGQVTNSFNDGTIVRNNIFQDEKHHMIRFSGNITNTEISSNLFVTTSELNDVMMWYKEWGEIWPDKTVIKDNIFYNEGAEQFMKLGETTGNEISGNVLMGNSFRDKPQIGTTAKKKETNAMKSKVNQIREVSNRKDIQVSKATEVIKIMWPDQVPMNP